MLLYLRGADGAEVHDFVFALGNKRLLDIKKKPIVKVVYLHCFTYLKLVFYVILEIVEVLVVARHQFWRPCIWKC